MHFPTIYIVRSALFGADFTLKFWLAIFALALAIYDWRAEKRKDYLWVLGIGFLIWSGAEFFLQSLGIREMAARDFYGITLPAMLAIPLQGISEGAALIIFGLFIGDRIGSKQTRLIGLSLFFALVALILGRVIFQTTPSAPVAASRRELFAPLPVIFLTLVTLFDIFFWFKYPAFHKRVTWMVLSIFVVVTIWTIAQAMTGNRWIEVGVGEQYQVASTGLSVFAFSFDVIIEIILAYLPFFAIPVMGKKIGAELLSH